MNEVTFISCLKKNYWFLIPFLILFVFLAGLHLVYSKSAIHLSINSFNSSFLDDFFRNITVLGHGFFTMCVICLFLFFHFRKSIVIFFAFVASGIIVQSLKTTVFADTLRPKGYFEGKEILHFVDGVNQLVIQTFPSGHSASAFALFLCLAAFTKIKPLKFLFFILASLTAFSRVYISQHFLIDAMAGSVIGVVITIIVLYYFYYRKPFAFLDSSIIPNQVK
jgi:membrane-associated phospholipid phosphatase